ncbi:Cryptic asc operon repressor [Serratia odorifera]|uniref:Cryptic asc operon repressor n=1 Tax=Serratia odorifera TaxID=618 RepID=A0A447KMZ2_SEROD|nr:Cryptic asc operon repressor [Serratia odorifera]
MVSIIFQPRPYLTPALTSVKDPVSDMINEVINRLIAMLDGGYLSKDTLFSSQLIVRDSVAHGPFWGGDRRGLGEE